MLRSILSLASTLLFSLLLAGSAGAQDLQEQANTEVQAAQELEKAGKFPEAAERYRAAYKLVPHPALLFNLGQAYRQAGDETRAYHFYKKYLAIEPGGQLAELSRGFSSELRNKIGASIETPPTGDDILGTDERRPSTTTTTTTTTPGTTPATGPATATAAPLEATRHRYHLTPLTWTLAGVSVASLTAGAIVLIGARTDYRRCEDNPEPEGKCATDSEVDSIRKKAIVGDVLMATSLATFVAGATLYYLSGSTATLTPEVSSSGASISWTTRF